MLKLPAPQAELRSINYGHFGIPTYNPIIKEWAFSKLTSSSARFVQLGPTSDVIEATGSFEKDVFLREIAEQKAVRYALMLESELRLVVASFPELQPSEEIVKPLLRLSEGIARSLVDSDPAMTELVDIGVVSYTDDDRQETIRLLATPGGECGQALKLTRLDARGYRTEDDQDFELELPTEETGWWTGKGAPILQICFSHDAEKPGKNALLAVRLQSSIIFMCPRYRNLPVSASGELDHQYPPSRIDPNILFELSADQAHGTRLADVSFNPWNCREFVVVDLRGQWTMFTVVRKDGDYPVYEPRLLQKGRMPKEVQEDILNEEDMLDDDPAPIDDPGAEPEEEVEEVQEEVETLPDWAMNSAMPQIKTSVSKRASPVLSKISKSSTSKAESDEDSSDEEMQDGENEESIKRDEEPADEEELREIHHDGWLKAIWVLNADTLLVCSRKGIHVLSRTTNEYFNMPKLRMTETRSAGWFLDLKLCQRHTDHVLVLTSYSVFLVRIHEVDETPNDVESTEPKRVLKSRIIISALHFRDPADTTLRFSVGTVGNGYLVTVFSQFNKIMTCFQIDMPLGEPIRMSEAMSLIVPEDAPERTLGLMLERVKMDEGLYDMPLHSSNDEKLYSVQLLGRDYGMRRAFFEAKSTQHRTRSMTVPRQMVSTQDTMIVKRRSSFLVSDNGIDDDQAEQGLQSGDEEHMLDEDNESAQPASATVLTTRSGIRGATVKYYELSKAMVENVGLQEDQLVPSIGIGEISAVIQTAVDNRDDEVVIPRTLFEHIDGAMPKVEDLRDASFELEDAVAASSGNAAVRVYPQIIPLPRESGDDEDDNVRFGDMHTDIQDQYVVPLDGRFSEPFREQRQWLAKSIAAELMLSSARVEYNPKNETKQDEDSMFVGSSLPVAPSQATIDDEESATQQEQRKSPYEIPLNENINTILDRLRHNVTLEVRPSQKWSLKGMVMLSHWDIGTDPSEYNHAGTASRLEEEKELLGMSESERRRLQKKQDRDRLRREREARKTELLLGQSSQAPSILSSQLPGVSSQNVPSVVGLPASQQIGSSQKPSGFRKTQDPGFGSQSKTPRSTQTPGFGSQAPSQPPSQVPGFRPIAPRLGGQLAVPGFGSVFPAQPSSQMSSQIGSQIPGFGSQRPAAARSKSQRGVPGFGPPTPLAPARSKTLPTPASQSDGINGKAVAGPSQSQNQDQQFSLPVRPTAASLPTPALTAGSQVNGSSQASTLPALSQPIGSQPPSGSQSQRPASQLSSSQAPRKKTKRTAGF